MIKKVLALTLCGLIAQPTHALDPASVPPDNRLFIQLVPSTSGLVLEWLVRSGSTGACIDGTTDVFVDRPGAASILDADDVVLVACTSAMPISFGQSIVIAGNQDSGDATITRAVSRSLVQTFLDPDSLSCDPPIPVGFPTPLYRLHADCVPVISRAPDAGIVTTPPELLLTVTPADVATLRSRALYDTTLAPAVNLNLYRELQVAQSLIPNDDESNVPSLTRPQLYRIFSGEGFVWDEFSTDTGAPFLSAQDIYVCRRGADAAVQAATEAFLLNSRCVASVPGFVQPDDLSCLSNGCDWTPPRVLDFVFAADSASDMRECLDGHNDVGNYAIGLLSTNTTISGPTREFRFLGIDQAPPTLQSIANSDYSFFLTTVLIDRNGFDSLTQSDIADDLIASLATPSAIAAANALITNPGGDHGFLALSISSGGPGFPNPGPVTAADMAVNPVNSQSRTLSGNQNYCQPPSVDASASPVGGVR